MVLIDRNKLIMYIADCRLSESISYEEAEMIIDFLINAPVVEKRVKGKWENRHIAPHCSNCGEEAITEWNETGGAWIMTPYCPFCGADMRGEEE